MVSIRSPLKGKRVGIIGFNARPIACSAKKAGASVFVSDYWGDDDLSACCDDWIAILTPTPGARQRQPLDIPLYEGLVENLLYLTKERELDHVILGSGFDDHVDALAPLHEEGLLIGCSPNQMRRARDFASLAKIAKSQDIHTTRRLIAETPDEAVDNSVEFNFPYLVRPIHSGGGSGIRFVRNSGDVVKAFGDPEDGEYEPRVVQEYVRGVDISCSVLAAGSLALSLSVQGQLIGMPTAGRNCGFAYCGNYYPSNLAPETATKISEVSEAISSKLDLNGSVGLDFIVDESNQIWLMEVNPRIQGTLELMEAAGNISVTSLHVLASQGLLSEKLPSIEPGVKMIVYSRRDGAVPDLSQYTNTVDRSPPGVMVNMGDPICTVIEVGSLMRDCYRKASETALAIQNHIS
ncbi:MAG: Carbamoyl-phosphate synthase large chain [Candidatus Thorarchaeota archaeon AB_25]|nr:MAG: Carbamoyl-phosphate synthase large chain [Candidatus Thorarchaeota archaeon AB_25]